MPKKVDCADCELYPFGGVWGNAPRPKPWGIEIKIQEEQNEVGYLENAGLISHVILAVGVVFFAVLVISAVIGWLVRIGKPRKISLLVLQSLFFASVVAGFLFIIIMGSQDKPNLIPLQSWWRIGELGYVAVCIEMGLKGAPFFLMGVWLPLAYPKINRIYKAAIVMLGISVVLGIIRLALGLFNMDEVIYGVVFGVAGFCFTTLLAWIFVKNHTLHAIGFSKRTHVFGVFFLMGVYFSFMLTMFLNNGSQIVNLRLPAMSQSLPAQTIIADPTILNHDKRSVSVLKAQDVNLEKDIEAIARILGMNTSQKKLISKSEAQIQDGDKQLTLNVSGYWQYHDDEVLRMQEPAPAARTVEIATELVNRGLAPDYSWSSAEIEQEKKDEDGTVTQQMVYITGKYNEMNVIGSCEFFITVGGNGKIAEIEKYDPNFKKYKSKRTISSKQAFEYVQAYIAGEELPKKISVSHTLYQPAASLALNDVKMAYWLEETNGTMQPIWLFTGTANMQDGTQKEVKVYVSALG